LENLKNFLNENKKNKPEIEIIEEKVGVDDDEEKKLRNFIISREKEKMNQKVEKEEEQKEEIKKQFNDFLKPVETASEKKLRNALITSEKHNVNNLEIKRDLDTDEDLSKEANDSLLMAFLQKDKPDEKIINEEIYNVRREK